MFPTNFIMRRPKLLKAVLYICQEGQLKLNAILENLVFPGVITVTDLINEKHIMSYANISVKVDISDKVSTLSL